MKKTLIFVVAILLSTSVFSQQTIQSRQVDAFRKVSLTGDLTVELIRADTAGVDIRLNNTTIDKLQWGVKDGQLSVRLRPGTSNGTAEVKIYYTEISELAISRANVSMRQPLQRVMFDVSLDAGATLGGRVEAKDLALKVSGNSAANLTGQVQYFTLTASGNSKVNARELECTDALVQASSSAEVYVWSRERLQLTADSGASIYYRGSPEIFRATTKMMGTVNNIGK